MKRFTMIASSYLILIHDGKYSLPAGHIEDNESLTQGAAREVFEEIGVTLEPQAFKLVHIMHRKEQDIRMDFFFAGDIGIQSPVNKEPKKCDDLGWFPLPKLPVNTISYIRHAIACYQKKIVYSEFGWE